MIVHSSVAREVPVAFGDLPLHAVFFDGVANHGIKISATACWNLELEVENPIPAGYPCFRRSAAPLEISAYADP